MERKDFKKVLISIPIAPNSRIDSNLVNWLIRNITYFNYIKPDQEIKISYDIVEGKPIDSVRNKCMNKFLATDNDYILTVDSDIVPPMNTIQELIKWDKDIIGAACFSFQYGYPFCVIVNKTNGGYVTNNNVNKERLVKCDATGAACVLIKRKVIEDMKQHLLKTTGRTMFYETKYNEDGELSWGQDFWFCENALNMGLEIFVDTHLLADHYLDRVNMKRVNDILVKEQDKILKDLKIKEVELSKNMKVKPILQEV